MINKDRAFLQMSFKEEFIGNCLLPRRYYALVVIGKVAVPESEIFINIRGVIPQNIGDLLDLTGIGVFGSMNFTYLFVHMAFIIHIVEQWKPKLIGRKRKDLYQNKDPYAAAFR